MPTTPSRPTNSRILDILRQLKLSGVPDTAPTSDGTDEETPPPDDGTDESAPVVMPRPITGLASEPPPPPDDEFVEATPPQGITGGNAKAPLKGRGLASRARYGAAPRTRPS